MNLGVFISAREPNDGGGYTLTKDLFDRLIKNKNKKNFFFILRGNKNKYFQNEIKKKKLKYVIINDNKLIIFVNCIFFKLFNTLLFNNKKINFFVKKNSIKCIVFLSSENFYPLKIPYISTVWDIQHKTNPHFKETGSILVNLYRSIVINIFLKNSSRIISGTKLGIKEIKKYYHIKNYKFYKLSHPTPSIFLNTYKIRNQTRIFKNKNFFIYPSNFWEHKNHLFLIKTIKEINKNLKIKKNLLLVGSVKDRKYYNKIKIYIKNSNLSKNVKILNFISIKKLIFLYDRMDALVYPSTSGPENLPPLEAFARGKNAIVANYPGAKEQLKSYANYFNLNNNNNLKVLLLSYRKKNKNTLIKFAKSKSTKNYIDKLIHLIESDFYD